MNYNLQRNLSRFGTILYRFSYVGLFCVLASLVSEILVVLIYIILLMIGLLSFLTLFFNENYRSLFDVTNSFNELLINAKQYLPLVAGISLCLLVFAGICMLPDYKNRQTKIRLILCGILILIFIALFIYGIRVGDSYA